MSSEDRRNFRQFYEEEVDDIDRGVNFRCYGHTIAVEDSSRSMMIIEKYIELYRLRTGIELSMRPYPRSV